MHAMLWIKCFHVLAVMAWLAGIFYLPRIFVHYAEGKAAGEDVRRLVIMAGRLYGFMTLMALFALSLGIWLWQAYGYSGQWLRWKLLFVLGLIGYHLACRVLVQRLRSGALVPSGRALRWFNEGALLLVVPIVILAIVKPFG
jgi:putative membrane protein